MNPLVSVITPAYNAETTLLKSVNSVLSQSFEDIELLIIVNGCTDKTEQLANEIASNDNRVKIFQSSKGKVPARNLGLMKARGEIIALNDADDLWKPEKLKTQIDSLKEGFDVVAGKIECIDEYGKITSDPLNRPLHHLDIVRSMLAGINPIANSAAIFKKKLLDYVGTYDDCFPFCEDYHFWLKAVKFAKFRNVNEIVLTYFTHSSPGYDPNIPVALSSFYRSLYSYTGVVR